MYGPGLAPTQPRRPSSAKLVTLRVVFTLLALGSFGILSWAALLRVATVTRKKSDWQVFWGGVTSVLVATVLIFTDTTEDLSGWRGNTGVALMVLNAFAATAYYLYADIRHYQDQPWAPAGVAGWEHPRPHGSGAGPAAAGGVGYPPQPTPPHSGYGYPPQHPGPGVPSPAGRPGSPPPGTVPRHHPAPGGAGQPPPPSRPVPFGATQPMADPTGLTQTPAPGLTPPAAGASGLAAFGAPLQGMPPGGPLSPQGGPVAASPAGPGGSPPGGGAVPSPPFGAVPASPGGAVPSPPTRAVPPPPSRLGGHRIDQVRAELDELSDYLRRHGEEETGQGEGQEPAPEGGR